MERSSIKDKIKTHLEQAFHLNHINDDTNIFESGIVNSLFHIQLLVFIEKTFDITLEEHEIDIQTLNNINTITDLIYSKLAITQ